MNFYAVIIGTEILNNRRQDKHFSFVRDELAKYGHELYASFTIKDEKRLIAETYKMIQRDPDAIMFSFGGIGSTPDDLTREIAAEIFTDKPLQRHEKFYNDILERFREKAFPHRIHMADLPVNATLLFNPINNMSGFALENRYFFVPGFPSMAHPMIQDAIKKYFSQSVKKYRKTLYAHTSEEQLIDLMQQLPTTVELSCLPLFVDGKPHVELSLSATNKALLIDSFALFEDELKAKNIYFKQMEPFLL